MHIPKDWRLKRQRYQLQATQYADGDVKFPPRPPVRQRIVERYHLNMQDEWSQSNSQTLKRKTALVPNWYTGRDGYTQAEIFLTN